MFLKYPFLVPLNETASMGCSVRKHHGGRVVPVRSLEKVNVKVDQRITVRTFERKKSSE